MPDEDEEQRKETRLLIIQERRDRIVELFRLSVERLGNFDEVVKALPEGDVFIRRDDYDVIPAVRRIINSAGFEEKLRYLLAPLGEPLP